MVDSKPKRPYNNDTKRAIQQDSKARGSNSILGVDGEAACYFYNSINILVWTRNKNSKSQPILVFGFGPILILDSKPYIQNDYLPNIQLDNLLE